MLESTLVAIARSFKRFAPRKDWFLIVMNNDPQAVSLGSNMFLPKKSDEKRDHEFGVLNFVSLFRALFATVRLSDFDHQRRARFLARYGAAPETVFGGLFIELTGIEQCRADSTVKRHGPGIETRSKTKSKKSAG